MINAQGIPENTIGFLSYARRDDEYNKDIITKLRGLLEQETSSRLGQDVRIFQDTQDISWGVRYLTEIGKQLGKVPFFIPVLSPSYFQSNYCIKELKAFLKLERTARLDKHILPILFIDYEHEKANIEKKIISELEKREHYNLRQVQQLHKIDRTYIFTLANDLKNRIVEYSKSLSRPLRVVSKSLDRDRGIKLVVPKTIKIRGGEFWMGSPPDDETAKPREKPYHKVKIKYDLEVGIYPITFQEWDSLADYCLDSRDFFKRVRREYKKRHCTDKNEFSLTLDSLKVHDEGWGRNKLPVINVSWDQAQVYAIGLSLFANRNYRLLSEAEWEYCCRAASAKQYAFGNDITQADANYGRVNGQTTPVNSGNPNGFGLYHMHGQVWEWVEDIYHDSYNEAPGDGSPWVDSHDKNFPLLRVVRGGSWKADPATIRSAFRGAHLPNHRVYNVGFRIACNLGRG